MFIDFRHSDPHQHTDHGESSPSENFDADSKTPFKYLVQLGSESQLPASQATVDALDALGEAMIDAAIDVTKLPPDLSQESSIPPIYTYWAQFLDHELTARTDQTTAVSDITVEAKDLAPVARARVEKELLNRRTPAIELDSVYGDGLPGHHGIRSRHSKVRRFDLAAKLRDGDKLRVGTNTVVNWPVGATEPKAAVGQPQGPVPPFAHDLQRDLPRIGALLKLGVVKLEDLPEELQKLQTVEKRAFIADPRNDENLLVAQFHVAILRFHNAVVDYLRYKTPRINPPGHGDLFQDAQRVVRWTFQWLVVNDFLRTLLKDGTVSEVLTRRARTYLERAEHGDEPYMPLEFSAACYRFGHSMVRELYDHNRNFGRELDSATSGQGFVAPRSTLQQLFEFTGKHSNPFRGQADTLPHNWIIEWQRFDGTKPLPLRAARLINTRLDNPLGELTNEGEGRDPRIKKLLKQLARRNLRRGYQLSLPTAQALAGALGITPLTPEQIGNGNTEPVNNALKAGGFIERTPLWFYTLKEAEVLEGGNRLGPLASRVIAETILGVLLADPESYLVKKPTWSPAEPIVGVGGPLKLKDGRTISKIGDLLEFAGVKPPPGQL